jgi:hypothetical protein
MKHYAVTSPVMSTPWSSFEPQEYYCCFVFVEAESKRHAAILAVQHPDMSDWVLMQRGDNKPPFQGLKVEEAICHHGVLWVEGHDCEECEAEWQKELAESELV